MQKNVAGQKWIVFAFDRTDNTPKTGDAANITANLRIDGGAANAVDDANPTELEDGYYVFDITQAECNGDMIVICPASGTADIQVIGVPGTVYTTPENFPAMGIESDGDLTKVNALDGHTAQSADHAANISAILTDTGTTLDGKLDTIDGIVDAILVDTGTTLPATLTTMEGKIDTVDGVVDSILVDTGTTLDGKIDTIDGNVDSILTDTGTTLPGTLTTIEGKIDTVDGNVDSILVDTGTTLDGKIDSILTDTGTTLDGKLDTITTNTTNIETDTQDIQSRLPAALVSGRMSSDAVAISGSTDAADKLEASAETIVVGTVSHNNTAATTTVFYCDDITEATADHFNGRIVIFTSGALLRQATDITDYELSAGEGKFTVTDLTEAPADNVTFVIV